MESRIDTLTEHSFQVNARISELETNVLLLGVTCVVTSLALLVMVKRGNS